MRDEWLCGYAAACRTALALYVDDRLVAGLLDGAGLTSVAALRVAGVDDGDIDRLRPVIAELQRRKRHGP